jgi:hypothetical protein
MKHVDFIVLIQKVYRSLFNAVERLQTQSNLIIDILTSLGFVVFFAHHHDLTTSPDPNLIKT